MPSVFKACNGCLKKTPGCHDRCIDHWFEKVEWEISTKRARYGSNVDRYHYDRVVNHYNKTAIKQKKYPWTRR